MSKERELLAAWLCVAPHIIDLAYVKMHQDTKELLIQPEQEPVAWKVVDKTTGEFMFSRVNPMKRTYIYDDVIPLYTAPQSRKPLNCCEIAYPEWCFTRERRQAFEAGVRFAKKHMVLE